MGKGLPTVHARIDWTTITNTAILFTRRRRRQWQPDNHSTITRSFTTMYIRRRFLQPNKKRKTINFFVKLFFIICVCLEASFFNRLIKVKLLAFWNQRKFLASREKKLFFRRDLQGAFEELFRKLFSFSLAEQERKTRDEIKMQVSDIAWAFFFLFSHLSRAWNFIHSNDSLISIRLAFVNARIGEIKGDITKAKW